MNAQGGIFVVCAKIKGDYINNHAFTWLKPLLLLAHLKWQPDARNGLKGVHGEEEKKAHIQTRR